MGDTIREELIYASLVLHSNQQGRTYASESSSELATNVEDGEAPLKFVTLIVH